MVFNPKRLVGLDTTQSVYLATIVLSDDRGARVIADATLKLWRNIGVIKRKDNVTIVNNEGTLIFFVDKPVFDVKCHLEMN